MRRGMSTEEIVAEILHFTVEYENKVVKPLEVMARRHVTGVQFGILLMIQHYGPMSMSCMADKKHISRPQLTVAVEGLVHMGLVTRRQKEEDRRIVLIHFTEKGLVFLKELQEEMQGYLKDRVGKLEPAEREQLYTAMNLSVRILEVF